MLHAEAELLSTDVASRFTYDAFVVHAAADEWFVHGYLLDKLGVSPGRVLLPRTLEPGRFVLGEIDRGVRSSQITIVVLSSAYLADHWAVFGEQIAAYASVARDGHGVLLPLVREDCALPPHIRALVMLDFRDSSRDAWDTEANRLRRILARPVMVEPDLPCPYPGMRPFAEKDARMFFGRDAELDDLVCRLQRGDRAIVVVGASGSGKSSLITAGLVPRLARGVAGLRVFHVRMLRPGEYPFAHLGDVLEGDLDAPAAAVESLLARHAPAAALLLIVDQIEELFAVAEPQQREAFVGAVRALSADPRCVLVFSLRSDFYGAFLTCPLWTDLDSPSSCLELGALRNDNLKLVIERPAQEAGVHVQPELVSRLLIDAAREPGALALLQATLFRLWSKRRQRLLSLADHQALSDGHRTGLAFAISEHAEEALTSLTSVQEVIAFRIVLRLVHFGEGRGDTRRQQVLAALRSDGDDPADFEAVLQRLVDHRLVTMIGDKRGPARVDLAHEILIASWATLAEWIRIWRVAEQHRRELEASAASWRTRGSSDSGLLDACELANTIAWRDRSLVQLGQTPDLAAFLAASDAAQDRSARQRRLRVWLTVAIIIAFVSLTSTLALLAYRNAKHADRERRRVEQHGKRAIDSSREHRRALGMSYQESGRQLLDQQRPLDALPFFLEARKLLAREPASSSLEMMFAQAVENLPVATFDHPDSVRSATYSPDGTRIVTSAGRFAQIWDVRSKLLSQTLHHHDVVNSAVFDATCLRVATTSADRTASIWDVASGRRLFPPLAHHRAVNSVAFSADGKHIVTASDDFTARIWDAASGKLRLPPLRHRGAVKLAAFSPDGTRVVTASADGTARVWDTASGKLLHAPLRHRGAVNSASFSVDGSLIVTGSDDQSARIWSAASGRPLSPPLIHDDVVHDVAFSPDGSRVLVASGHSARIWIVASRKRIAPLLQHMGVVRRAAFSIDGSRIVTASDDHTARIWDASSGDPLSLPLRHHAGVATASFSSDGTAVLTASSDRSARIWEATPDKRQVAPLTHDHWVLRAAFHPDGSRVVTAGFDHTVRIWDSLSGEPRSTSLHHERAVNSASFSPDGSRVVTASSDHTARIWDTSGAPLSPPLQHLDAVQDAAFSPDGSRVVTASWDHTARVWDVTTGKPTSLPLVHRGYVVAAAFSPDGSRIVTASFDRTARIWDAVTGKPLSPPLEHQDRVVSAEFSPDGSRIATASLDNTARLWNTATGAPLSGPLPHDGAVWSATFSADGDRIVTASFDGTARIWDAESGKLILPPLLHRDRVNSATFSSDGTRVVTASWDQTARIWDLPLATGQLAEWTQIVERASPYTLVNGVLPVRKPSSSNSKHD